MYGASAADNQFGSAAVQVMGAQFKRHRTSLRIEPPSGMSWDMAFRHSQKLKHKVGVKVFQDKLALPIGDCPFLAVRVARRSKHADSMARPRGANEHGCAGERLPLVVLRHTSQGRTIIRLRPSEEAAGQGDQSEE